MAKKIGEAQISHFLIPNSLFITPSRDGTSIFGVTWRPVGVSSSISLGPIRLTFGTGLLFSYAYIDEQVRTTHFIRPGIDVQALLSIPLHKNFIISGGGSYAAYIPQSLGDSDGDTLWNVRELFVLFNYRFPFKANI